MYNNVSVVYNTYATSTSTLFFRSIPFIILALLLPSLPVVTQIRGHIAGGLLRPPHYGTRLYYMARSDQHFPPSSTRVELCLPTLLGALSS